MGNLKLDFMEYATDGAAQAAYLSSSPSDLLAYSENTIKTEGDYSLKVIAGIGSISKMLSHMFSPLSDLTHAKNLKFDIRSNRVGSNVKLKLYSGGATTGGTITTNELDTETGLVLHLKMNENDISTYVEDSSPSANHGTSTDYTSDMATTGKINGAFEFGKNSTENPITLSNRIVFGEDATINVWVKDYHNGDILGGNLEQAVARLLFFYSDGGLYLGSNTFPEQVSWPTASFPYGLTDWHMFTIRKTGGIVELLVDLVSQGIRNLSTIADLTVIGAGSGNGYPTNFTIGSQDDFRVYDRALSTADLAAIFNGGLGTEESENTPATENIHTFTTSGIFSVPQNLASARVLVVAGGGGGGNGASSAGNGGGGGAGGLLYETREILAGSYNVEIGDGGNTGINGEDSTFDDMTAIGGGAGGVYSGISGQDGGSGGGSGQTPNDGAGIGTIGQGNNGGYSGNQYGGGGGGGAVVAGQGPTDVNGFYENGGNGGDGLSSDISGQLTYYAGGGGGSSHYSGNTQSNGGLGGGGKGAFAKYALNAENGVDGLGGGGGAGGENYAGGKGGKGIIIIRYAIPEEILISEIVPNVAVANQFQTVNWDISGIDDEDKNQVSSLKIVIENDSAENTFYIDNFEIAQAIDVVGMIE